MRLSFNIIRDLSSLDVRLLNWYGRSFCNCIVEGVAIRKKFGTKCRYKLQRPKNNRNSGTFIGFKGPPSPLQCDWIPQGVQVEPRGQKIDWVREKVYLGSFN